MRVTIKQIAEEAEVSLTTVSNVINKRFHRVSKEKIALIESIIEKYNYTPNMNARSLVQSSSQLIGLLYYSDEPDLSFSDPFIAEILSGINEQAKKAGYFVLVHNINSKEDVKTIQKNWLFEGFIVVGVWGRQFVEINEVFDRPVVYIDTHLSKETLALVQEQPDRSFVNTDDYAAGVLAVEHLIDYGHSNIAFLSYDYAFNEPSVIEERYRAYVDTLKKHDLRVAEEHIYTDHEFDRLLKDLSQFSAIVVTGDFLVARLFKYLKNRSEFSINTLSVVSFDDISFAELMDPPLTTVRLEQRNKGILAFEQLIALANDQEVESHLLLLEGQLISRKSVRKLE